MSLNPLAQWAVIGKSSLTMAQQWQDAAAAALNALLKTQLELLDSQRAVLALHGYTDLYHELAGDLATQRQALTKAVIARAGGCVDDLRRTGNQDDVAIVLNGFMQDVGTQMKDNAEQAFTLLNSARAASLVLAHQALDGMQGPARDA